METAKIYIRGNETHKAKIVDKLIELGGDNQNGYECENSRYIYFIDPTSGSIRGEHKDSLVAQLIMSNSDWAEMKLSDVISMKPFTKVLVRNSNTAIWSINIFSHYNPSNLKIPYVCMTGTFAMCVPYEGNEDLLNTRDGKKQ